MPDRIPLIYILSSGRSGTTLLDLLIGSAQRAWTVGEAQLLPWELREQRSPCGCARPVSECPFWSELLDDLPLDQSRYPIEHFREAYGVGRVVRWRRLPGLLRGRTRASEEPAVSAYGRVNAAYLRTVWDAAGSWADEQVRWLVDASMDPYRLLWLKASDRFDLRVVHLTKSPPAFVYSMVRDRLPAGWKKTIRMAGRWLVENALMVRLCDAAFVSEHVRRLRYEDLAGQPDKARRALSEWLDLEFPPWDGRTFRSYENHAISGNEMRWEDTEVELDTRWRHQLPDLHRRVTGLITAPLAARLGY